MTRVTVLDGGTGNLYNVLNGLRRAGGEPVVLRDPAALADAPRLVIPGVAAFDAIVRGLGPFQEGLGVARSRGVPILGICAGLQAMYARSEEGASVGLGWLPGTVRALRAPILPHMGWTPVWRRQPEPLLDGLADGTPFYFAHSYAAPADGAAVAATATHGTPFAAVVRAGATVGVQFHPERSGRAGRRLLENFLQEAD